MKKTAHGKNGIRLISALLTLILASGLFTVCFETALPQKAGATEYSDGASSKGKKSSDKDDEEDEKKKEEEAKKRAKEAAEEALNEQYPVLKGDVTIKGTARIGFTLYADVSIDNEEPGMLSFTWIRYEKVRKKRYEDEDGDGEYELVQEEEDEDEEDNEDNYEIREVVVGTEQAYAVQPDDVGCRLAVVVKASNMRGELVATLDEEGNQTEYVGKVGDLRPPAEFDLEYEVNVTDDGVVTYIVTIPEAAGCEYSFDGESWSDYNVFPNVQPGSDITGFRRYKSSRFVEQSEAVSSSVSIPAISAETKKVANPNAASAAAQANVKNAVKDQQKKEAEAEKAATEEAASEVKEKNAEEKKEAKEKAAAEKKAEEEKQRALEEEQEKADALAEAQREAEAEEAYFEDESIAAAEEEYEDSAYLRSGEEAEAAEGGAGAEEGPAGPDPQSSLILLIVSAAVVVIGGFVFLVRHNEKDNIKEISQV